MPAPAQIQAISLSELTGHIAQVISGGFANRSYWVIADVSNHSFYPGKEHHYFELVEKEEGGSLLSKMQAVAWRSGAGRIRNFEVVTGQRFRNGIKVSVKVQVDYHAAYGLKLVVQDVDPAFTIGQLELHRQATINRLLRECSHHVQKAGDGFRTRNNSLSHNLVIQRIAVLSSSSSAGYQDFMHTLLHNQFGYQFSVNSYFTTVQGEANAEAASHKIAQICASNIAFDALVIIRGGGADTDFLIFDQFVLCQAVAGLHIPVITGIGHLKNQTLVDLMAHTSTNVPTKAAEFIIAHNHRFETALLAEQKKVVIKTQQILGRHTQAVVSQHAVIARKARALLTRKKEAQEKVKQAVAAQSRELLYRGKAQLAEAAGKALQMPRLTLANCRADLKNTAGNLSLLTRNYFSAHKNSIGHYEAMCRMMSPVNILKKGFALVYQEGQIITNGSSVAAGSEVKLRLLDSEIQATVQQKNETNGDPFNL